MSTSNGVSRIHPGTILDIPAVRSELQEVWDEYEEFSTVAAQDGFEIELRGLPSLRSLVQDGDVPAGSKVGSEVSHWTEATTTPSPAQGSLSQGPTRPSLLTMPPELLEHILKETLGEQIIHVDDARSVRTGHALHCQNPGGCLVGQRPRFYLRTCDAQVFEEEALHEFRTQASNVSPDDDARWYVEDASLRHEDCRPWEQTNFACNDLASISPWKYRFGVLHVCRHIASRALRIFWQTNTFSFGQPASFCRFLRSLSDRQLQLIRKIHLCVEAEVERYDFDPAQIMRLVSLDHLHISVHSMNLGYVGDMDSTMPNVRQIDLRKGEASMFLRCEVLNLKRVTVIVYDDERDFDEEYPGQSMDGRFQLRFTLDQKRDLAEMVESTLSFDDETKQVLAAKDRQVFEMEELLKAMKFSLNVRYQVQRAEI